MVSGQLSALLLDWTAAIIELNIPVASSLLEKEPELLWTPVPQSLDDLQQLQDHLATSGKLGGSFQPVSAIQYVALYFHQENQEDRFKFLTYLIGQSSLHDLDTRFWGERNNLTLHLVCFLGHLQIVQLLIEKGVSVTPANELGFTPKDVTESESIIQCLTTSIAKNKKLTAAMDRSKSTVRPNYSTPDRFKLLRDLAEGVDQSPKNTSTVSLERQKSEVHYFRKGRVKETQQKVLTEEEKGELEKAKRQLEVAQLVKKSAVKNNPLFKKLETRSYTTNATSPTPSPSTSATTHAVESDVGTDPVHITSLEEPVVKPKRNSKVISSLQKKSYVSTSIFVQADEIEPKIVNTVQAPLDDTFISLEEQFQQDLCVTKQSDDESNPLYTEPDELPEPEIRLEYDAETSDHEESRDGLVDTDELIQSLSVATVNRTISSIHSTSENTSSSEDSDNEEDDDHEFEEATPVQFATRLVSPVYKSVILLNEHEKNNHLEEKKDTPTKETPILYQQTNDTLKKRPTNQRSSSLVHIIEHEAPARPQRSELRRPSQSSSDTKESKEKKRMSGTQKAAWTMSMSSWAAILDREFSLEELDQEKKSRQAEKIIVEEEDSSINYLGDGKLQITADDEDVAKPNKRDTLAPLQFDHPPQIQAFPRLASTQSISRKPLAASYSTDSISRATPLKQYNAAPPPPKLNIQHRGDHGKLYLHVNGIQDILLPLPKERAYVRCVVSDGRFEYMSRYEILSQNINFDYECVIDTHPDMIITISLHVRPDYVMKSKKPFSRLFSSKKKKETLRGYVNKEDGAIGQARFALAHMLPVCVETTYLAGFHCFNAWFSRSYKEKYRQKKQDPDQDVLKVVGNFDVEMLYLPVQDYHTTFPRNLRECALAIKQLHQSVENSNAEKYHTF